MTASLIKDVTGVAVLALHHDIRTVIGEEVVLFTSNESPLCRGTRKK